MKPVLRKSLLFLAVVLTAMPAVAADDVAGLQSSLDYVWIMVAAALVFLMQGGFMCLESGLARAKNSINVAIKNMADFIISVSVFWMFGFGIMFGASQSGLFGTDHFFADFSVDPWIACFFVFQAVFCGTAATIDSGAVAERTRFGAYLAVSLIVSGLIYPIYGHWAWGSFLTGDGAGWLESMGFVDFAGSTVVHSIGGWVALAGIMVIGPRLGRFDKDGNPRKIHAHSLPLAYLGTFILFFGWFGFNCGSTLAATTDIAGIAMTTMIAACFGGLSASLMSWFFSDEKLPEAEQIANGVLGGLVAITAGCAVVSPASAAAIGLVAGVVVYGATILLERVFKLDDVVGAVPVHGCCGAWGTIATGIFMTNAALADAGVSRWQQIGTQAIGVAAGFAWAFGTAFVVLKVINMVIPLRVSEEDELLGLNVAEHGATSSILELAHSMQAATESSTYDESLKVAVEHGTEIGDLGRCFNEMLDAVRSEQQRAQRALQQVEQQQRVANEGLARYSEHVDDNVQAIDNQTEEIETILNQTAEQADTLSGSIQEVLDSIEALAGSLTDVAGRASQASEMTARAVEESSGSRDTINRLGDSANDAQRIVTTIDDITEQTNLLALNATIEASRAGDAGKGFAVVASEVKELAHQAAGSTDEINRQLGTMQQNAQEAAGAISSTADIISQISDLNSDVNACLMDSVDTHSSTAHQVSQVVAEATQLAEQIKGSIDRVKSGARQISSRVTETSTELKDLFSREALV